MSVHSRNLIMYTKGDEQIVIDERNNNVKNDHITKKSIEKQTLMNEGIDLTNYESHQWNSGNVAQRKINSEYQHRHHHKMEKHPSDLHLNDLNAIELVPTTKINTAINFSVDSILGSSKSTKQFDAETVNATNNLTVEQIIPPKCCNFVDLNRIHRPMPMRYLPNQNHYHGLSLGSQPSSLHRHLKYPISNYSCPAHFPSNFSVDRFLLPNTAPTYPQFSNHRTDCHVDPTNPKITSIPPPSTSSVVNPLSQQAKRKRSWSRAVFSQLQRKGLEIQFQIQKYITKPDRRKLAARLGLTDAQVKVWFQNRRMKWRHSKLETKSDKSKALKTENKDDDDEDDDDDDPTNCESRTDSDSCSSGDDHEIEIDIEAE